MTDDYGNTVAVQPAAAIPDVINAQPEAINLYKWAVLALAIIGGVGLVGCLVLAGMGRDVPEGAIVLASVAVGALAGMIGGKAAAQ
jgi:hypothetical protein